MRKTEFYKTLGILGGGQLGQMSAKAAKKLGIRTIILTPEDNAPASQVANETIVAPYEDKEALKDFAEKVDIISYEFENIPVETVKFLKTFKPVFPEENLLEVAQDRLIEKQFLNDHGIPTAKFKRVQSVTDIENTLSEWNTDQCIIKTTRFGYDGKGQFFIKSKDQCEEGWITLGTNIAIAEEVIDFECEISIIIARDNAGNMQTYGPCLNEHKNHILHKTTAPFELDKDLQLEALNKTKKLAEALNLRGVLALEMFVTKDGKILANEIAPRTHNSGHWTIDACETSQFDNHVRTVCGLPVAEPNQHSEAEMINLIGEDINNLGLYQNNEKAYIHDYGKGDARPGRKMGHVTLLKKELNTA